MYKGFLIVSMEVCPVLMGVLLGVVPPVRTKTGLGEGFIFEVDESCSD